MDVDEPKVTFPTFADLEGVNARCRHVELLLHRRYGRGAFTKSKSDLALLQMLLNDGIPSKFETFALQSLGLVLGGVFERELGLHWVVVEDQHGRDLALRFAQTSVIVFPLTMISKRVAAGETPPMNVLFDGIAKHVCEMAWNGI